MGMKRLSRLSSLGIPLAGAVLLAIGAFANTAVAQEDGESQLGATEQKGKELAFDRQKGNCLACHKIPGGELPGNLGPSLVGVADRLSKDRIEAQIQDSEQFNQTTSMPPFGKHKILSQEEIDKVVAYLMTLHYK
jgi:sulfur-oxidizing protein SoxX